MNSKSRTRNTIRNALWGLCSQVLTLLLKFVCRTVFIKTLGVTYLGINGLFSDILMLLSLAELGFDTAITYRLYKPVAEGDVKMAAAYVVLFRRIYRIVGLAILFFGLVFIPLLRYIISDYDKLGEIGINAVQIFLLYLLQSSSSYFFGAYRSIILRVQQKQYLIDITSLIIIVLSSIVQIVVLVTTKDFVYYIWTLTFFVILQNVINGVVASKYYPQFFIKYDLKITKDEIRDLFKDCSALFVYKINNVVMKATDNIVLSALIGLAIVGLYSNYLLVYAAIIGVLQKILNAVKDSLGNLFVSSDVEKKYFFFEVMNLVVVLLYGTIAVCFTIGINKFIYLWIGADYMIPQPFPLLIGIELFLNGLKQNLAQIRHVSGVFRQMWYRPVIGSIINVFFSVLLALYWGISGVVLGTIAAAVFANLSIDPHIIHKYSFNNYKKTSYYYKKNVIFLFVIACAGLMEYYFVSCIFKDYSWINLIVSIIFVLFSMPMIFVLIFHRNKECVYILDLVLKQCFYPKKN